MKYNQFPTKSEAFTVLLRRFGKANLIASCVSGISKIGFTEILPIQQNGRI